METKTVKLPKTPKTPKTPDPLTALLAGLPAAPKASEMKGYVPPTRRGGPRVATSAPLPTVPGVLPISGPGPVRTMRALGELLERTGVSISANLRIAAYRLAFDAASVADRTISASAPDSNRKGPNASNWTPISEADAPAALKFLASAFAVAALSQAVESKELRIVWRSEERSEAARIARQLALAAGVKG